jgi:hypothetical protein
MYGTMPPSDRGPADRLAQTFREIDWLVPAYLSVGFLYTFAHTLDGSPPEMRLEVMRLVLISLQPRISGKHVCPRECRVLGYFLAARDVRS